MSGYQIGQRVALSGTVQKVRDRITWRPKDGVHIYREARGDWETIKAMPGRSEYGLMRTHLVEAATPSLEGVIVGKRTMAQGVTETSYDEPSCFLPCETNQVWLVSFNLRRKPVMCFDHQIAAIETGPTVTVPAPHVPYPGPHDTDATFMRGAAKKIAGDYPAGGSNVKRAVIKLLNDTADAMEAQK